MKIECLNNNCSTTRLLSKKIDLCSSSSHTGNTNNQFETALFLPEGKERKGEGGLRTKGYFKFSYENLIMNDECLILNDRNGNEFKVDNSKFKIQNSKLNKLPLISIITVVYNGEKYLEETIQSVINQTYPNVEYIIIDGGSTDGTIDIIKKYEDKIDYWVSESDDGIYYAMNKGIDLVSGKWINFMNAGDRFYDSQTLEKVFANSEKFFDVDVIYGDSEIDYGEFKRFVKAKPLHEIWKGMVFSHQSCFISSKYHKRSKYLLEYNIGADFDLFYKTFKDKKKFTYINYAFSIMTNDGISDQQRYNAIGQWQNIINKYDYNIYYNLYYGCLYVNTAIREVLKKLLPKNLIDIIKKNNY